MRRLAYILLLLLFVPLATEGAYRLLLRFQGSPYDAERVRARIVEITSFAGPGVPLPGDAAAKVEVDDTYALHPYTGFDIAGAPEQINRDLAAERRAREDELTILVTGGSVALHFHDVAGQRLLEHLRQDPMVADRPLRLLRYARSSFKQPQQLTLLAWLFSIGIVPDVVINLDGFNELAIAGSNTRSNIHPAHPAASRWGQLVNARAVDLEALTLFADLRRRREDLEEASRRALESSSLKSAILGRAQLARIVRLHQAASEAGEALENRMAQEELPPWRRGPDFGQQIPEFLEMATRVWLESSRSIAALCEKRGTVYLHVLQPTMHDKGSKPLTPEEVADDAMGPVWVRAVQLGYPGLREAGSELAAEGIAFFDASMIFSEVQEQVYFDGCHMLENGNQMLADAVAPVLLEALK